MKNKIIFFIILFLGLSLLMPVLADEEELSSHSDNLEYATGRVIQVVSESQNKALQESMGGEQIVQQVKLKVLNGKYKGKVVTVENQLTSNPAYDIKVQPGSRVILDVEDSKPPQFYVADKERTPALMIVAGIFFSLLLFIGGMKGLSTMLSVGLTSALVLFVLMPGILNGYNPIVLTVIVSVISTLFTMYTVGGLNLKSTAASIGTVLSLIISGVLAFVIIKIAPLSGLGDQEAIMLYTSRPDLNFTAMLTSAMIIGALGAIMDIGMSIASTISELKITDNSLTPKQLFSSGMNVGRDIIGTMSNTLILAYIGSAFSLILMAYNAPLIKLINLNSIASEIVSALVGTIGIILCIPITAGISGYLLGNKSHKK